MDPTFSELLKILKPQLSKGKNVVDFTQHVIQSIVNIPEGEDDSALDISESALKSYYYGNSSIDKLAEKLSGFIDASELYTEIDSLNENARQEIANKLQPYYPGIGLDNVADVCSATMEKLFNEAAERCVERPGEIVLINPSLPTTITNDELTLVLETRGICRYDNCGKPLSVNVNGKRQYIFVATKIDPALNDSLDNMIALCPDCSSKYNLLRQKTDIERLKQIKHQLILQEELGDAAAANKIEEGIKTVIERIANMPSEELIPLNYKPVEVERKITPDNVMLKNKVLGYVNAFYPQVKATFQRMDEAQKIYYDGFAASVKLTYMRESRKVSSQSMIFNALVEWLMNGTNTDREPCEVVISYFVQNCEVFDEISE